MRHIDILESTYDGAIPPELIGQARALDAAAPPLSVEPAPRGFGRRRSLTARMAALLTDRAAAAGCCSDGDLAAAGFTRAEVESHGEAARSLAAAAMADRCVR